MAIHRSNRPGGRTSMDVSVLQDNSLSFSARGLYGTICYLQQHEGIEHPTVDDLRPYCNGSGRERIRKLLKELRNADVIPPMPRFGGARKGRQLKIRSGWVYLIEAKGCGRFKIGVSAKLLKRVKTLKNQSPFPQSIIATISSEDIEGLESYLHDRYAPKRVHGEWFELAPEDVKEIQALGGEG